MTRRYIAKCRDIENHDPIESGSPRGVWNQLQKATGRDRKWLQDFGWRVILKPTPAPAPEPEPPLVAPGEPLWLTQVIEDDSDGPNYRGWGIAILVSLILWAIIYYFLIR